MKRVKLFSLVYIKNKAICNIRLFVQVLIIIAISIPAVIASVLIATHSELNYNVTLKIYLLK